MMRPISKIWAKGEKINQRLFKRLILYYNDDCGLDAPQPAKYSQKQTALHLGSPPR